MLNKKQTTYKVHKAFVHNSISFSALINKLILFFIICVFLIYVYYGSTGCIYILIQFIHKLYSIKYSVIRDQDRPMLSARYLAFESLIRLKPFEAPDSKTDPIEAIKQLRASLLLEWVIPRPRYCRIYKQNFQHHRHLVETYWIDHRDIKENISTDNILLYFHGGAYIIGDIQSMILLRSSI